MCDHRTRASIGTHDMGKITMPVTYTAMEPENLMVLLGGILIFLFFCR